MGKEQLTNEELLERFPQLADRNLAMKTAMEMGMSKLLGIERYVGLTIKEEIVTGMGDFPDERVAFTKGYSLVQKIPLENPIQEKNFFGKLKKPITHKEISLAYGQIESGKIYINQNDGDIIKTYEEIAEKIQNCRSVNLMRVVLNF